MKSNDELIRKLLEDRSWLDNGTTQTEHEIASHINMVINTFEKQPKWILCKDELPAQNTDVIITVVDKPLKYTYVGWQMGKTWISNNDLVCGDIIAWMPLLEPYAESEDK